MLVLNVGALPTFFQTAQKFSKNKHSLFSMILNMHHDSGPRGKLRHAQSLLLGALLAFCDKFWWHPFNSTVRRLQNEVSLF